MYSACLWVCYNPAPHLHCSPSPSTSAGLRPRPPHLTARRGSKCAREGDRSTQSRWIRLEHRVQHAPSIRWSAGARAICSRAAHLLVRVRSLVHIEVDPHHAINGLRCGWGNGRVGGPLHRNPARTQPPRIRHRWTLHGPFCTADIVRVGTAIAVSHGHSRSMRLRARTRGTRHPVSRAGGRSQTGRDHQHTLYVCSPAHRSILEADHAVRIPVDPDPQHGRHSVHAHHPTTSRPSVLVR